MYIPIVYRIELVNHQLLHDIYTVSLSVDSSAKLQQQMRRKRKINLTVLCSALILLLTTGAVLLRWVQVFLDRNNDNLLIAMSIFCFICVLVAALAANKCFVVAGIYLKALKIAYPNLPSQLSHSTDYDTFSVTGRYNKANYNTNKTDHVLLEQLAAGEINDVRARGLLHYAICRYDTLRWKAILAAFLCLISLIARVQLSPYLDTMDVNEIQSIALWLNVFPILTLSVSMLNLYLLRVNAAYRKAIETGYPHFLKHENQ